MSKYIAYTDGGCQNTSVYGEGGSAYLIIHNGDRYNEMVDSMCTNSIKEIVSMHSLPKDRFKKKKIQLSIEFE